MRIRGVDMGLRFELDTGSIANKKWSCQKIFNETHSSPLQGPNIIGMD